LARRLPSRECGTNCFYGVVVSCSRYAAFIFLAFCLAASVESFLVLPKWTRPRVVHTKLYNLLKSNQNPFRLTTRSYSLDKILSTIARCRFFDIG
jgi:hypothetical protein